MSRIHLPITSNQNHYAQLSWSCMIESSQFKRASCGVTVRRVPYRHCIISTLSHKIKLWEEPAPSLATTPTHKLANNTDSKHFQLTPIPFSPSLRFSLTTIILNGSLRQKGADKTKPEEEIHFRFLG